MLQTDVVIIGAGAIGTAIARELSRYKVEVVLLDKNEDVGGDASKSNSAIIHTGFDAPPGSLESRLVVSANPMYDRLCKDLDIPFKRTGAILVAVTQEEYDLLPGIRDKAYKNGVYDVDLLTAKQVKEMEPEVSDDVFGGLYIPRESIIDPFLLVTAQADNAVENGVKVLLSTKVEDINVIDGNVKSVTTNKGEIQTKFVVNAAGLFCDEVAEMVGLCNFKVHPRKGQFYILDNNIKYKTERIILPVPTKLTKGKLSSPTIHGNMLIGPTAEDLEDKFDKSVNQEGLDEVINGVKKLLPAVAAKDAITEYSGLRPVRTPAEYVIEVSNKAKGFIGISGIRSTGVTSSLAVGKYVTYLLKSEGLDMELDPDFKSKRKGIPKFSELSADEQAELIKENPLYGNIMCRCETVTEAEVLAAIEAPVGARSLDGIKRRVRAGMGRCQGGFCGPRIIEYLSEKLNLPLNEVRKNDEGSEVLIGKTR